MIDNIWDGFLMVETSLVNSVFGEIWLYNMHFIEMSAAIATIAEKHLLITMHEVNVGQFRGCFSEEFIVGQRLLEVVEAALCLC